LAGRYQLLVNGSQVQMERSCTNEHEAERAFRLACFFIAQGIAPSQITILAAYQAQASLIKGGDLLPVTLGDV